MFFIDWWEIIVKFNIKIHKLCLKVKKNKKRWGGNIREERTNEGELDYSQWQHSKQQLKPKRETDLEETKNCPKVALKRRRIWEERINSLLLMRSTHNGNLLFLFFMIGSLITTSFGLLFLAGNLYSLFLGFTLMLCCKMINYFEFFMP